MPDARPSNIACACMCAAIVAVAACSPKRIPPMSVGDLMEDRVTLDGVLMKCNQDPAKARTDTECLNARVAIERLASQHEPAEEAKRREAFERRREQLRMLQDRQRQEQEEKARVDPYNLPVVPVEPAPGAATPPAAAPPAPGDDKPPSLGRVLP